MAELEQKGGPRNVNVTLEETQSLMGRFFPCPICGIGLIIKLSKTHKPYCVCEDCGVQFFVRGKPGIKRLRQILSRNNLVSGKESESGSSLSTYNRLEQLRAQKGELTAKQGLIFRNDDLDNAIQAVDNEIERVQGVLRQMAKKSSK